jgi:hypothetical protein
VGRKIEKNGFKQGSDHAGNPMRGASGFVLKIEPDPVD